MPHLERVEDQQLEQWGLTRGEENISRQRYESSRHPIEGVALVKQPVYKDEYGGHFCELVRFDELGRVISLKDLGIDLRANNGQVNTSVLQPETRRFGHLHYQQCELWMVASGTLTVALYDLRSRSTTLKIKSRNILSEGMGIYIPAGVAHGLANFTQHPTNLVYIPSMHFSPGQDTQELRFESQDPHFWDFANPDTV